MLALVASIFALSAVYTSAFHYLFYGSLRLLRFSPIRGLIFPQKYDKLYKDLHFYAFFELFQMTILKVRTEFMKLLKNRTFYKFLIPSLIGMTLFVIPIRSGGNLTIPIAVIANRLLDLMGTHSTLVIYVLVSLSALISIVHKIHKIPAAVLSLYGYEKLAL